MRREGVPDQAPRRRAQWRSRIHLQLLQRRSAELGRLSNITVLYIHEGMLYRDARANEAKPNDIFKISSTLKKTK